jgi:hypothetical protein
MRAEYTSDDKAFYVNGTRSTSTASGAPFQTDLFSKLTVPAAQLGLCAAVLPVPHERLLFLKVPQHVRHH